jgi:hypothetical protein
MSSIFGEFLTFPQEKGPEVQLRVYGDEFYSRYENIDGYTVVYDQDHGLYCYALLISGSSSPADWTLPKARRKGSAATSKNQKR